ncbi:unnamed protein product [Blepharisma stoltei]|uniref:Histidine kinase n=1 Tax=Blepharisma stoltei TaxID=1481888 RepID=A0AAU9IG29_9CILI|nr:unnamed protein product [Blepharisma stoltei]
MAVYKKLWWREEVQDMYGLLLMFSHIFAAFSMSSRAIYLCFTRCPLSVNHLAYFITHITIICIVKYFDKKNWKIKVIIAVFVTEIYHTMYILSYLEDPGNPSMLQAFIMILLTTLELPMIKNKILFNLLLAKHIYIWFLHPLIFESGLFSMTVIQFNSIFAIFLLGNVAIYCKHKVSFEKFELLKEVKLSKERFEIITQAFCHGIIIITGEGKIEYFNSSVLNFLQCLPDCIYSEISKYEYSPGRKVSNFNASKFLIDDINYSYYNLNSQEATLGVTFYNEINLEWKARKIVWENKTAIFLTSRNVNEIMELEKTVTNDHMKSVLLRSVSHELRTPLNAISFFTSELLVRSGFSKAQEEMGKLKMILTSSKLMLSLIDDLLDYSKIISGVFTIRKTHFDIRNVIQSACELISLQASKKNLRLSYRIDPMIPEIVYTDSLRVNQILLNLLSNALKFTLKGSIEVCCNINSKNRLKFCIEDTGIGMSEQTTCELFTEFRTSYIPNINPQGSGLGLWISNFLAKQLGNEPIKVKSSLGKGSRFQFSIDIFQVTPIETKHYKALPEEIEKSQAIEISKYCEFEALRNVDVLIVDDNEFNRVILASILSQSHISCDEACNGKDALNKVLAYNKKGGTYKAIIMDCNMPEINGFEATKLIIKLQRDGDIKSLPNIIGYSAYSSDEDKNACYECGMIDYLTKPCPPEVVISTIQKYIQ